MLVKNEGNHLLLLIYPLDFYTKGQVSTQFSMPQISALVTFSPPVTFISQNSAEISRKVVESGVYDTITKRYQITIVLGRKPLQFHQCLNLSVVLGNWEAKKLRL